MMNDKLICPKCKRPVNVGNSPNPDECTETDDDNGLCEAYARIHCLTAELEQAQAACAVKHEAIEELMGCEYLSALDYDDDSSQSIVYCAHERADKALKSNSGQSILDELARLRRLKAAVEDEDILLGFPDFGADLGADALRVIIQYNKLLRSAMTGPDK